VIVDAILGDERAREQDILKGSLKPELVNLSTVLWYREAPSRLIWECKAFDIIQADDEGS
jgi:hypothetical protein